MKIVVLDGAALNPGDLSWDWLGKFGAYTVYSGTDSETEAAARIGDAEIVLTNKTVFRQRATMWLILPLPGRWEFPSPMCPAMGQMPLRNIPLPYCWNCATKWGCTTERFMRDNGYTPLFLPSV